MSYDWVPTIGYRGQRHRHGLVGKLWVIQDPTTVRVGNCFMAGRLLKGDVVLCVEHSGDCFQTYRMVEELSFYSSEDRAIVPAMKLTNISFGSYQIGDATEHPVTLKKSEIARLLEGEVIRVSEAEAARREGE